MKKFAIKFQDDVQLNFLLDDRHEFLLTTKEVALGYGVNTTTIRRHKQNQSDELVKSKHWVVQSMNTPGGIQNQTLWTKRGIIRLGFFIKSERAKKFRDWCEDLIINSQRKNEPLNQKSDIDGDIMKFYDMYGILNPNAEFYIEHMGFKAKAYVDDTYGFIISTGELSRIMGVKDSTLRVLKKYHGDRLKEDKHFVKFGYSTWWTREGAGWIALHNRDGSFGRYLLSGDLDKKLDIEAQYLDMESLALLDRVVELSALDTL
jgi:prophage antirepressor-like protein